MAVKNAPNRHVGICSSDCNCGLVHDDEMNQKKSYRDQIVKALGSKCVNPDCRWMNEDGSIGCTDLSVLEIDHVFEDGALERKSRSVSGYLSYMLKNVHSGRYQLLCANCHSAKTRKRWDAKDGFAAAREANKLRSNDAMGTVMR